MEPDLHVFARAPAGVPGAHAGDHAVGPGQGEGGGERIPGRGEQTSFCKLTSFFLRGKIFASDVRASRALLQILIELETALLDDEPHWYKLQTHDVSSIPLPRASPNTQRRQFHGESPTRRLQSTGFLSYFTDACLTKPQILRDSLHVADGKAIKLHLHSNFYLYASTDLNISQGNKSRQGEFY